MKKRLSQDVTSALYRDEHLMNNVSYGSFKKRKQIVIIEINYIKRAASFSRIWFKSIFDFRSDTEYSLDG